MNKIQTQTTEEIIKDGPEIHRHLGHIKAGKIIITKRYIGQINSFAA